MRNSIVDDGSICRAVRGMVDEFILRVPGSQDLPVAQIGVCRPRVFDTNTLWASSHERNEDPSALHECTHVCICVCLILDFRLVLPFGSPREREREVMVTREVLS